ncbi:MAG TPA: hypothetical protein VGI63_03045 [Verrucomicrobiae bacterium]
MRIANCNKTFSFQIIFSVLLTAIFLFPTSKVVAQVATNQSSTNKPAISAAQFKIMDLFCSKNGDHGALKPVLVSKLGLPDTAGPSLPVQQDGLPDAHIYLKLSDGTMVFTGYSDKNVTYNYHVNSNLKLINSTGLRNDVPFDIADPESGLKKELAFWPFFADNCDTDFSSPTNSPTK